MKNTNFQNLRELLKNYTPETSGIATAGECNLKKRFAIRGNGDYRSSESTGL